MGRLIRALAWVLILAAGLTLAACGQAEVPEEAGESSAVPGLYTCYALSIQDLSLDPARRWLRLLPDGTGILYLEEKEEEGTWTLEGDAFLWSSGEDGGRQAAGVWTDGVLKLTIGEMAGIFVREGVDYVPPEEAPVKPQRETGEVPAPEEAPAGDDEATKPVPPSAPAESKPATPGKTGAETAEETPETQPAKTGTTSRRTTYPCYGGLYYVDYDPQLYSPGSAGGADLVREDGTSVWFARLATRELTDTWLAGLEEKIKSQEYLSCEGHSDTAAGCPVRAVVYQDEEGWHAEAVVDLGEDRGSEALPMYAVYLTAQGPSRQSVWTEGVNVFLNTLRLGEPAP